MLCVFLTFFLLHTSTLAAQEVIYSPDSLTTKPAIPRSVVAIPPGKPSGPNARLQMAIYRNIRYPRTALASGASGKIIIFGVIDTLGVFSIDSAVLYEEQATIVLGGEKNRVNSTAVLQGKVDSFFREDGELRATQYPKPWSKAQEELVQEAIRVADGLPAF